MQYISTLFYRSLRSLLMSHHYLKGILQVFSRIIAIYLIWGLRISFDC